MSPGLNRILWYRIMFDFYRDCHMQYYKVHGIILHSKLLKGEEEALFLEYRKQLKVLFDNIAQLVRCQLHLTSCSCTLSPEPSLYSRVNLSQLYVYLCNMVWYQAALYSIGRVHRTPKSVLLIFLPIFQDPPLVLQTAQSLLASVFTSLSSEPFMNVEVALRVFYMSSEVITDKVSRFGKLK